MAGGGTKLRDDADRSQHTRRVRRHRPAGPHTLTGLHRQLAMSQNGAASDPPVGTPVQPVASTSAAIEPRPSLASPWTESGSFYAFGSGSPRILHTRRAPPFKGRSHKASPSPSPSHLSRPASPAVLMTTAVCCCCGTELRYPRASPSFRCPTCDQIVDLSAEARRGKAPDGALAAARTDLLQFFYTC